MSTRFFKTLVAISAITFVLTECRKEAVHGYEQQVSAAKSSKANINSIKHDLKILFVREAESRMDVYAMNIDGSNTVQLTNDGTVKGFASWSPNGQHIAFSAKVGEHSDIFIMNVNGENVRNITNTPDIEEEQVEWAPDNNRLVFNSNAERGRFQIHTMDINGKNMVRLTDLPLPVNKPTWSPDGSKIAFEIFLGPPSGMYEIMSMNADGSNMRQVTNSPANDQMPSWSPDGSKIAFMSTRTGNPEIFVVNSDGSNTVQLTHTGSYNAFPSWSKEGHGIVFVSERRTGWPYDINDYELYRMNEDGSNVQRLTSNLVYDNFPFVK